MGIEDIQGINAKEVERKEIIAEAAEELEEASNGIITERQAHAYVAREIANLSRQETMALLGVQPSTVDSLFYKGREKVRGAKNLVELVP